MELYEKETNGQGNTIKIEEKKPINGKFKDQCALQKAYESLEKEFTRRSQRLREFQKQIDELKSENAELYKERTALIAGSILEKQNIVKDTAKEILQEVGDIVDDGDDRFKYKDYQWHKNLCKHYGVEVE